MRFATIVVLFAAAVLGAPTQPFIDADTLDQGDGFYFAVFNETGADVQFTPLSELTATTPVDAIAARSTENLLKRGTECSGRFSGDVRLLDEANVKLAQNANGNTYGQHAWGWVHYGGETSYFCNYQSNYLTYQLIIDMHIIVSNKCGQAGYGFDRRTNCCGARDLAVGRTWRGDSFCDGSHHG